MTKLTPFKFEFYRGLPPDKARGQFFGFDAEGNAYILRWSDEHKAWGGIGFDKDDRGKAFLFMTRKGDTFIAKWAPAPLTRNDMMLATARNGVASLLMGPAEGSA